MKKTKNCAIMIILFCVFSLSCNRERSTEFISDIDIDVIKDTLNYEVNHIDGSFIHFVRNDTVFFTFFENNNYMKIFRYENNCNCLKEYKTHIVQDTVFAPNDEYGSIAKIVSINDRLFWFYKSSQRGSPHDLFLYDFSKNEKLCCYKTTHDNLRENKLDFWIHDEFVLNPFNNKLIVYAYSEENKCTGLYFEKKEKCILSEISCNEENDRMFINIKLPDIYDDIDNGDYSYDSFIYLTMGHDNIIIVSFALSQQILLLNGSTMEYHLVESKHANYRDPIKNDLSNQNYSYDNFIRNAYRSFAYKELMYNPYRQEYYRFYQTEMPDKHKDGTFTTAKDMKTGVFVMTKNFESHGDFLFSDEDKFRVGLNNTFPTEKGFVSYYVEEDRIIFIRFEVKK